MSTYFAKDFSALVDSPNGSALWWHSLPLPDGRRINGSHPDKDLQLKMWDSLQIPDDGLRGKAVLDIGANDGFFSVAAALSMAESVTAINSADWVTWPRNINFAADIWRAKIEVITGDFRAYDFGRKYDAIFLLGVLYHLENVFDCIKCLRGILTDRGSLYIETHVTDVVANVPIFEYASDTFPTSAPQGKSTLGSVGISNYLFPNTLAVRNLAESYDFKFVHMNGPENRYTRENPRRHVFRFDMT